MLKLAELISFGLGGYALIGIFYGLFFITRGLRGESIAGKGFVLRVMLFPGAVLLWPFLIGTKP